MIFFFDQKIGRLTRLFRMKTNLSSSFVVQRWQILFKFCLKIRRGLKKHWGKIKMSARVVFRVFCHHPVSFCFKMCYAKKIELMTERFFKFPLFYFLNRKSKAGKFRISLWILNFPTHSIFRKLNDSVVLYFLPIIIKFKIINWYLK